MYAVINRRRMALERAAETRERGRGDFFPVLEEAPGFVCFTLLQAESGVGTAIALWASQADAEAFMQGPGAPWMQTLNDYGHQLDVLAGGEIGEHRTAPAPAGAA